jgi:hypothetical protein
VSYFEVQISYQIRILTELYQYLSNCVIGVEFPIQSGPSCGGNQSYISIRECSGCAIITTSHEFEYL